ncbi:MAG TPA: hypothetical protein VM076_17110 [Gemmatimonadaceae bacterium]|nr:hypothetical protein [Gemmatimonadaceae bacterium]
MVAAILTVTACAKPDAAPHVTARRPTVIAYFIIPQGAVDTMPNLAVEADDWNVAMATLGDSLQASGIGFRMTTNPSVRVDSTDAAAPELVLGDRFTAGYVFVRAGETPCLHRGALEQADVLAVARGTKPCQATGR